MPAPSSPVLYTAAGSIKGLWSEPNGTLWAATGGGVLCWTPGQPQPRRWTVADGMGSNDVRAVGKAPGSLGIKVTTAQGQDWIDPSGSVTPWLSENGDGNGDDAASRQAAAGRQAWIVTPSGIQQAAKKRSIGWPDGTNAATVGNVTGIAANTQGVFLATGFGLWRWAQGRWQALPLPPGSPASHVSALGTDRHGLLAGLYGDGVYRWNRKQWQRLPDQPAACRFATALTQTGSGLAVGTQAEGVWREQESNWQQCPLPAALPPSADIGSLAAFRGALWASSFSSGLMRLGGQGGQHWQVITCANGLSSNLPRQMVVFGGALYVRGADGQVDSSKDGSAWHPAFSKMDMPRPPYALGTDGRRLLLGTWAGWAATDGHTWERHPHDPALQGQVVTAIAAQGSAVWIGTQKRGLLRYENGRYTAFQEAAGLTDDWITCIAVHQDRLLVGTYTGGLLEKQADRFHVCLKPRAFAIRAIAFDNSSGMALAATPLGLYREEMPGKWTLVDIRRTGGLETQAVLSCPSGAWIATRTSVAFVPKENM